MGQEQLEPRFHLFLVAKPPITESVNILRVHSYIMEECLDVASDGYTVLPEVHADIR